MSSKKIEFSNDNESFFSDFSDLKNDLENHYSTHFNRSLPQGDYFGDRWEKASKLGFGKGSSIYDSSYVIGKVIVGENCWVGMFTILDGSGGLSIGSNCTISAGVHIYSHDNLHATLVENKEIERAEVKIGNRCYLAPNSIVTKGVQLGDRCVVAANSLVKNSFPSNSIIAGNPAKKIGIVKIENGQAILQYSKTSS